MALMLLLFAIAIKSKVSDRVTTKKYFDFLFTFCIAAAIIQVCAVNDPEFA
jgi:hypothetical protein